MKSESLKAVITCPFCNGTGRRELSDKHQQALAIVRRKRSITVTRMLTLPEYVETKHGALINRLEFLRGANLLDRKRDGHSWKYFPIRRKPIREASNGKPEQPPCA